MGQKARCAALAALWLMGCSGSVSDDKPDDATSQGSTWGENTSQNEGTSWGDSTGSSWNDNGENGSSWNDNGSDGSSWNDNGSDGSSWNDNGSDGSSWNDNGDDGSNTSAPPVTDDSALHWQRANVTYFESYPEEGSEECIEYNGCAYFGRFAGYDGVMPYEEVARRNIAAVRYDHFEQYVGHTLRLRDEGRTIDVEVLDMCSDSDCSGCCTRNSLETGFLIDLEIHTAQRFGTQHGVVEWACLDC